MTQVTIPVEMLDRLFRAYDAGTPAVLHVAVEDLRAALQAAPAQPVNQVLVEAMTAEVKEQYMFLKSLDAANIYRDRIGKFIRWFDTQAQPLDTHGQDTKPVVSQNDVEVIDKPAQGLTDDFLQPNDYYLLHRFIETTEDGEGYDITKVEIKRLADLGVVQSHGFGKYSVTMFGHWVHERYWEQNPSLPLKTNTDRDVEAAHGIQKGQQS